MHTNLLAAGLAALICSTVVQADPAKPVLAKPHAALECPACHEAAVPSTIPKNEACLACHGSMEKLVRATSKYALNPHRSPHWGDSVPCGTCHKQHSSPKVYCAACHTNQNYAAK